MGKIYSTCSIKNSQFILLLFSNKEKTAGKQAKDFLKVIIVQWKEYKLVIKWVCIGSIGVGMYILRCILNCIFKSILVLLLRIYHEEFRYAWKYTKRYNHVNADCRGKQLQIYFPSWETGETALQKLESEGRQKGTSGVRDAKHSQG